MPRLMMMGLLLAFVVLLTGHPLSAQGGADDTARFTALYEAGKYKEAEEFARRILAFQAAGSPQATWQHNLAMSLDGQGDYQKAEPIYRQSLATLEQTLGPEHANVALSLCNLANTETHLGKFTDAEAHHLKSLAIRRKLFGPEGPELIEGLIGLAGVYQVIGRYDEVESLYNQTLKIVRRAVGPENAFVAAIQQNQGALYQSQGRFADAERVLKENLAMRLKVQGREHPELVGTLTNLANVFTETGRYWEAEQAFRNALEVGRKSLGTDHSDVAAIQQNLGSLYLAQHRVADAEPLLRSALATIQKVQGPEHPSVAVALESLASAARQQNRLPESEQHHRQALAVVRKAFGEEHVETAKVLAGLAQTLAAQQKFSEGEQLCRQALAIYEKTAGKEHPNTPVLLNLLSFLALLQKQPDQALPYVDRALAIAEKNPVMARNRHWCHRLRAEVLWQTGEQDQALAEAQKAMDLSDEERQQVTGTEFEQAQAISSLIDAAESLVVWNAERKNLEGALAAIERHRSRALIDQMQVQGTDLLVGLPAQQVDALRQREQVAQTNLASLRSRLETASSLTEESRASAKLNLDDLERQLSAAQGEYLAAYREILAASPTYWMARVAQRAPIKLAELQTWLSQQESWLIEYYLGAESGFVIIIPPVGTAQIVSLEVTDSDAAALGVQPGKLTTKLARQAIQFDGVDLPRKFLAADQQATVDIRLQALWRVLFPTILQKVLLDGRIKRLVVVPDESLAALPLETLIVEAVPARKHLLEVGPPIVYAPSATVAVELATRNSTVPAAAQPVLSVGDPNYDSSNELASLDSLSRAIPIGGRFGGVGVHLNRLPNSGNESAWVAEVLNKAGLAAQQLMQQHATEAAVRSAVSGRRYLHLACHGLADDRHGNLFGALALTPGANSATDTSDDGFLTLTEIYQLNLQGCELAILSACDTNFGPQQQGEGTWSLARGFLVAGSRRVVASSWLVDDEAAATLVSYLATGIARGSKPGPTDHAAALHNAKKWIRQQDKWRNPYYWGSFVLIGPN